MQALETNKGAGEADADALRRVCDGGQSLGLVAEVESRCEERRYDRRATRRGSIGSAESARARRRGNRTSIAWATRIAKIFALHTNEDSAIAMRAPGHPQASYAIESLIDELAYKIKMDPVEFRKKNLRDEVYHRQLDRGAKEIGWSRRNPVAGGNPGPLKRGIGCAVGTWGGGGNNQCKVDVTIARDGSVVVAVGTQDLGTGTRTYTRAIVAEELGLGIKDVKEQIGNSKLGAANPSGGSTTAPSLAPSVKDAAIKARMLMAERVAPLLGNPKPEESRFLRRQRLGKRTNRHVETGGGQRCPRQVLLRTVQWRSDLQARGVHGVCFAEVEVDVETGHIKPIKMVHIQDCGLPLNRLAMESQINGGMIQSLGMALWEGRVMDAQLGMQLNPGFGDYKLPGSLEMPEMVPIIDDDDKREAVIGMSEGCIIPAVGALVNAVFNATGIAHTRAADHTGQDPDGPDTDRICVVRVICGQNLSRIQT